MRTYCLHAFAPDDGTNYHTSSASQGHQGCQENCRCYGNSGLVGILFPFVTGRDADPVFNVKTCAASDVVSS